MKELPHQIIDFSYVFDEHPAKNFVGRTRLSREIGQFLSHDNKASNLLFVHGESGIGKTSLIVNIIRKHVALDPIYYFVNYNEIALTEASAFLKHIYYSLVWRFRCGQEQEVVSDSDLANLLNRKMTLVNEQLLERAAVQVIFVDALDEVIKEQENFGNRSITDLLPSICLPGNFKLVITSTRKLRKSVIRNPKSPKIISMIGNDIENIEDIRSYFIEQLTSNDNIDLKKIVENSQGNFQYAIQFVLMAQKGEVDLSNPPRGLEEIYDLKLNNIRTKVERGTFELVITIIRLIAIMSDYTPPTIESVRRILEIDFFETEKYFFHVEQFLSIKPYESKPNKGILFHHSFHDYILGETRLTKHSKVKLNDQIVKYIMKTINSGNIEEIPFDLVVRMPVYFLESSFKSLLPSFVRKSFLPEFWASTEKDSWEELDDCVVCLVLRNILWDCLTIIEEQTEPWEEGLFEDYAYITLVESVVNHHSMVTADFPRMTYSLEKDEENRECRRLQLITEKYKGYDDKNIRELLNKSITRSKEELHKRVSEVWTIFPNDIHDMPNLLIICKTYVNNWFPAEENKSTETTDRESKVPTQFNVDIEAIQLEESNIYLHGISYNGPKSWRDFFNEKGEYKLFIDVRQLKIWSNGDDYSISIKDKYAFKMLCLIALTPRGDVITYESFYKYAWVKPRNKSEDDYIEAVQKQFEIISSTLFENTKDREKYIWAAPKRGYQATDSLTMVLRLETKSKLV